MSEIIQIKCPTCSAILKVKPIPNIETRSITCPVCKQKNLFTDFVQITQKKTSDETSYASGKQEEPTSYAGSKTSREETQVGEQPNYTLGRLMLVSSSQSFQLKSGRNIVGRKASNSTADIQIPFPPDQKRTSRAHLLIEVKKVPAKGYQHVISLCKEKVNPTFVNGTQLLFGDKVVLKSKDLIRLPDGADLLFTIPDEDETVV